MSISQFCFVLALAGIIGGALWHEEPQPQPTKKIDFFTHTVKNNQLPPAEMFRQRATELKEIQNLGHPVFVRPPATVKRGEWKQPLDLRCTALSNFALGVANARYVGIDTSHHVTASWVTSTIDKLKMPSDEMRNRFFDLCNEIGFDNIPK